MDNKETFLYTVNPRKIIVGLPGVKAIRSAKSLHLTKEDVLVCLKKATVYRRFANEGKNIRVTPSNLDRLHNANFISEEEWIAAGGKAPVESTDDVVRGTIPDSKTLQEENSSEQINNESKEEIVEFIDEGVLSDDDEVIKIDDSIVEDDEVEDLDAGVSEDK